MNGCEVGSATETIFISPSVVTVTKGQSVEFTASGGYEYTWELTGSGTSSNVLGTISSTRGPSTTYTCVSSDAGTETLTVSSMISGDATSATNSASMQGDAKATITHLGS